MDQCHDGQRLASFLVVPANCVRVLLERKQCVLDAHAHQVVSSLWRRHRHIDTGLSRGLLHCGLDGQLEVTTFVPHLALGHLEGVLEFGLVFDGFRNVSLGFDTSDIISLGVLFSIDRVGVGQGCGLLFKTLLAELLRSQYLAGNDSSSDIQFLFVLHWVGYGVQILDATGLDVKGATGRHKMLISHLVELLFVDNNWLANINFADGFCLAFSSPDNGNSLANIRAQ